MVESRNSSFIHQKRLAEKGPLKIDDVAPGDQVLCRIIFGPGDLTRWVWGYVLAKKPRKANHITVVVDDFVQNATAGIQNNDVVDIDIGEVCEKIPASKSPELLHIELQDGVVINIRRIDGKTSPVLLQLEQDGRTGFLTVDHRGRLEPLRHERSKKRR